jgi:hypothetical protein
VVNVRAVERGPLAPADRGAEKGIVMCHTETGACRADRASTLAEGVLCLDALSKDAEGELIPVAAEPEECRKLDCRTLVTTHALRLEVRRHDCDSETGSALDGSLLVRNLTTVFVDADPEGRGVHAGDLLWRAPGLRIVGTIAGMTNVGTHREPAFEPVQQCDSRGFLEGRFCGQVRAAESRLDGSQVTGVYRLRFDPTREGGRGGVRGTLEGVVLRDCDEISG